MQSVARLRPALATTEDTRAFPPCPPFLVVESLILKRALEFRHETGRQSPQSSVHRGRSPRRACVRASLVRRRVRRNKPITLKGTLTKVVWFNPHGWIYVDVNGKDGKAINWAIEFGSSERAAAARTAADRLSARAQRHGHGYLAKNGNADGQRGERDAGGWAQSVYGIVRHGRARGSGSLSRPNRRRETPQGVGRACRTHQLKEEATWFHRGGRDRRPGLRSGRRHARRACHAGAGPGGGDAR